MRAIVVAILVCLEILKNSQCKYLRIITVLIWLWWDILTGQLLDQLYQHVHFTHQHLTIEYRLEYFHHPPHLLIISTTSLKYLYGITPTSNSSPVSLLLTQNSILTRDITMGVLLRTRKAILEGGYGGHPPAVIWLDPLHPQPFFCRFFAFFCLFLSFFPDFETPTP